MSSLLPLKKRPLKTVDFSSIEQLAISDSPPPKKRRLIMEDCPSSPSDSSAMSSPLTPSLIPSSPSSPPQSVLALALLSHVASQRTPFLPYQVPSDHSFRHLRRPAPKPLVVDVNGGRQPSRISNAIPRTISCPDCGKNFDSITRFRAHQRRHSSKDSGRYQCLSCGKNFVQRSSLRTHERIHTGERPFKCLVCPEAFGDYSTFTKHQRTHTGEKPYPCPVCGRRFSQSGNMHRHLKAVHEGKVGEGISTSRTSTGSSERSSLSSPLFL